MQRNATLPAPPPAAPDDLLLVCTSVADEASAELLARAAVQQGLAACVHAEPVTSTYCWQGALQQSAELRLQFKTTRSASQALQRLLLQLHPYELPALYVLPVVGASPAYRAWVQQACRQVPLPTPEQGVTAPGSEGPNRPVGRACKSPPR